MTSSQRPAVVTLAGESLSLPSGPAMARTDPVSNATLRHIPTQTSRQPLLCQVRRVDLGHLGEFDASIADKWGVIGLVVEVPNHHWPATNRARRHVRSSALSATFRGLPNSHSPMSQCTSLKRQDVSTLFSPSKSRTCCRRAQSARLTVRLHVRVHENQVWLLLTCLDALTHRWSALDVTAD